MLSFSGCISQSMLPTSDWSHILPFLSMSCSFLFWKNSHIQPMYTHTCMKWTLVYWEQNSHTQIWGLAVVLNRDLWTMSLAMRLSYPQLEAIHGVEWRLLDCDFMRFITHIHNLTSPIVLNGDPWTVFSYGAVVAISDSLRAIRTSYL